MNKQGSGVHRIFYPFPERKTRLGAHCLLGHKYQAAGGLAPPVRDIAENFSGRGHDVDYKTGQGR